MPNSTATELVRQSQTFGSGKLTIVAFTDGTVYVSGYGNLKACYRGACTYWAASPAIVGLTKTPFGVTRTAGDGVLPSAGDLTTIGNVILQAGNIALFLANQPSYSQALGFT